MKKFYSLVIMCIFVASAHSQTINNLNPSLKFKLLQAHSGNQIAKNLLGEYFDIDVNNNSEIEVSEALQVSYIDVSDYTLSNLNGINNFTNLTDFDCSNNYLTSLSISLPNLTRLDCSTNDITAINTATLPSLTELICHHNNIASIAAPAGNGITKLIAYSNYMTTFDLTNFSQLTELDCSGNQLTALNVSNLVNITDLAVGYNPITTLDLTNLSQLINFGCDQSSLTGLDLSNNPMLNALSFQWCGFTSIDLSAQTALKYLYFDANQITTIDLSNNTELIYLFCRNNQLTSIDLSNQEKLYDLYIDNNLLTSLDLSQCKVLHGVACQNNDLTFMNLKNGSHESFSAWGNPLQAVCIDANSYDEYIAQQNLNQSGIANCTITSHCTFVPGGDFYTVQGESHIDLANDGCAGDPIFPSLNLSVTSGTQTGNFIANQDSGFSVFVGPGTHTITPVFENPDYFIASPASITADFPSQASPLQQDFCITANGVFRDLEVTILPVTAARPGFNAVYKIIYKNKGTVTLSGNVEFIYESEKADIVSVEPSFSNQSGNAISWMFSDLAPMETRIITVTLNINTPMETPAVNVGDELNFGSTISPTQDDAFLHDNTFGFKQTVVGAIDPNDKTCLEGETISPEMVGSYVHYLIRFENIGTANAENVIVKDLILPQYFDLGSLVPMHASHPFVTRIRDGYYAEFIFEGINLPFDDANNDGYIAFKIKTKPTLVVGNTFTNNANIYFDYNFPIMTNTTETTVQLLGTQDFNFTEFFKLYPNPVQNSLSIEPKNGVELKTVSIFNMLGQLLMTATDLRNQNAIDVSHLPSGNYFVRVFTENGSASSKFIKL